MASSSTTTAATAEQIRLMVEFMAENQDLARNRLQRSIEGRQVAKNKWTELTASLNSIGGAHKSTKQWQKVWADKKYLAKKAAAAANRSTQATGGGPSNAPHVSENDHEVLNIMGEGFGLPDTPVITEPFPSNESSEQQQVVAVSEDSEDSPQIFDIRPITRQESQPNEARRSIPSLPTETLEHNYANSNDSVTASPAVAAVASTVNARRRQRGLRVPRQSRPRALPDDVRTRLFRVEEEKKEEMTRIRQQLEKLNGFMNSVLVELRLLRNNANNI